MSTILPEDLAKLTQTTVQEAQPKVAKVLGGRTVTSVTESPTWLNFLFFGDYSVGKTQLAGSASEVEELSPVLLIDVEGGKLTLKRTYPKVDVVRVDAFDQLQAIYNDLNRGNSGYRTVIVDSLTELQRFSMGDIMAAVVKKDSSRDPEVASEREWGKNGEQVRRFVRAFRDLEMHTIFTALAKEDRNKRTGLTTTKPALPGQMANEVGGYVDEVYLMYVKDMDEGTQRLLLTTKTEKELAKSRAGMPMIIKDPTMKLIYSMIQERLNINS